MAPFKRIIITVTALIAAVFFFVRFPLAHAAQPLSWVSDTISDSRNAWPANHAIVFKVTDSIPASGKIVVAFPDTPFIIDPSFSYTDVDLAVSATSPSSGFVERSLAAVPDVTNDGVVVTSVTGPITITLSSGAGIAKGSYVRIMFGTNAPGGVYQITNPSSTASYSILLNTYDALGGAVDFGTAMVAILPGVGVDVDQNRTNPAVLSNGLPSGTIPSNITGVFVSFNTDVYATCKYATSSGILYDDMTTFTDNNSLHTLHTFTVLGIVEGDTYTYYVKCQDFAGNENPDDYIISFNAGQPTGVGAGGGSAGGGGGGGGGTQYPPVPGTPSLVITGFTIPNVQMALLEDGARIPISATADSFGRFSVNVTLSSQGTYSFTVQALNNGSTPITSYTATITLVAGTSNSITGAVLPPTIGFNTSTVALNKSIVLSGMGTPSSTVDLVVTSQANVRGVFEATTTVGGSGAWSYGLSTAGFPMDTYQIRVRALIKGYAASNFSNVSFLGIGEAPNPKLKIGDLSGDGKINLVDFSIMLAHWGTNYAPADLNGNGTVDLPDLSILLSHWTG